MICNIKSISVDFNILTDCDKILQQNKILYDSDDIKKYEHKLINEGIGIFVKSDDNKFVITCFHVINSNNLKISANFKNKEMRIFEIDLQIYKLIPEFDIAILQISNDAFIDFMDIDFMDIDKLKLKIDDISFTDRRFKIFDMPLTHLTIKIKSLKSNLVPNIPLLEFQFDNTSDVNIHGLSGAPIKFNDNYVGIVLYFENDMFYALPTIILTYLINEYNSCSYFKFNTSICSIEDNCEKYYAHCITNTYDIIYKQTNNKTFSFKNNDLIYKINDNMINNEGTIFNNKIGINLPLDTHLMFQIICCDTPTIYFYRNDKKVSVQIFGNDIKLLYGLNLYNSHQYIYWNGLYFAELNEEMLIQICKIKMIDNITISKMLNQVVVFKVNKEKKLKTIYDMFENCLMLFSTKIGTNNINNINDLHKQIHKSSIKKQTTLKFNTFPANKTFSIIF